MASIYYRVFFFICLVSYLTNAQTFNVSGKVIDAETGKPLQYANIRLGDSGLGTATNPEGVFEIRLKKGNYTFICSYMGFVSDTIQINVSNNISEVLLRLSPSFVDLSEVTVIPGENPANNIIRNAIRVKNERNARLNSYSFTAYTKGIIKTNQEVTASSNTISIETGLDTAELKINGILENESIGYFKKPDNYKEWITARKQTANLPSSINILTGGRIILNFYSDDINFFGRNIYGPLAENALSYYYFMIVDTLAIDNKPVYKLLMTPDDSLDPGFIGNIYITAETYEMVRIELNLNKAANVGGLLDTISIYQQFYAAEDGILMPVDYHLMVTAKILGLIKFSFQVNSILYNYKINHPVDDDIFNMAIITVNTDADKKDSLYWSSMQRIPETKEEMTAYEKIDSEQNVPFSIADNFSILSPRVLLSPNFSISSPLSLYHFNRVEGHSLDFSFRSFDGFEERSNSELSFSYGFNDKKFKYFFSTSFLQGNYRTYEIKASFYNHTEKLFSTSEDYSQFFSTLMCLLDKYDFNDYFYKKGFEIQLSGEVFPILKLFMGFYNRTDNTAFKNSDFSIFSKNKAFRDNPLIYETRLNYLQLGLTIDLRKYIEDGKFRRRVNTPRSLNLQLTADVLHSKNDLISSGLDFTSWNGELKGSINLFSRTTLSFLLDGLYTTGSLPYQMLFDIPGNVELIARENTLRTLGFNSALGDRKVTAFFEYNMYDELFRLSGIPFLKTLDLQTTVYVNGAYSDISYPSHKILPYRVKTYTKPLWEAGFNIGHAVFPIRFSFAWRLNHREENSFRFGLTSLIID